MYGGTFFFVFELPLSSLLQKQTDLVSIKPSCARVRSHALCIHSLYLSLSVSHPLVKRVKFVAGLFSPPSICLHPRGVFCRSFHVVDLLSFSYSWMVGLLHGHKPHTSRHPPTPHIQETQPKGNKICQAYWETGWQKK